MFLTDRQFWLNYWESHRQDVNVIVPDKNLFTPVFQSTFSQNNIQNSCELGGFPGTFSIYLKKKYAVDVTLLDYVVHREILNEVLSTNGLHESDIRIIEADLFSYKPENNFDLVFSVGLIEHFEDVKNIISLHLPFLKSNGNLLIFLPNFRGLNGWFQKTFDRNNYDKHNIKSMYPKMLKTVCGELGLKNVHVQWYGRFGLWLENENQQSRFVRFFKKIMWFTGKVFFKLLPIESKWFSPYILITARK